MNINNYSRNKIIYYEKIVKNILKIKNNLNNSNNDILITDIAFCMSDIANDKVIVNNKIEKKFNYLIKNTIVQSIHQINQISSYKKKEFCNNYNESNNRIGLKLSKIETEIIQDILRDLINFDLFYEMCLKCNNNNNNQTRNICVRFCPPLI